MVKDYLSGMALTSIHLEKLSTHTAIFLLPLRVFGYAIARSILTMWNGCYPFLVGVYPIIGYYFMLLAAQVAHYVIILAIVFGILGQKKFYFIISSSLSLEGCPNKECYSYTRVTLSAKVGIILNPYVLVYTYVCLPLRE